MNSRLSTVNKVAICKSIIRPVLTYGMPELISLLTQKQWSRLQILQNKALRFTLDAWPKPPHLRHVRIRKLHLDTGVPYIF